MKKKFILPLFFMIAGFFNFTPAQLPGKKQIYIGNENRPQNLQRDTIILPSDFLELPDGFLYKDGRSLIYDTIMYTLPKEFVKVPNGIYLKNKDYLIPRSISSLLGITISTVKSSGPISVKKLDKYVLNYKETVNGGNTPYLRQYSFMVEAKDIKALYDLNDSKGIRIYLGMEDKSHPDILTLILTAYDADASDIYLPPSAGATDPEAIDKVAPCPYDCPYKLFDAITTPVQKGKIMLGRHPNDPLK